MGFPATLLAAGLAALGTPDCSDRDGLERTVASYFEAVSGPRGETDLPRLREIVLPTFRADVIGRDEAGTPAYYGQDLSQFIHHIAEYRRTYAYYHAPSELDVRCSGPVASVAARFVSRNEPGDEAIDQGWIAFNLIRAGEEWRLAHVIWRSRPPD